MVISLFPSQNSMDFMQKVHGFSAEELCGDWPGHGKPMCPANWPPRAEWRAQSPKPDQPHPAPPASHPWGLGEHLWETSSFYQAKRENGSVLGGNATDLGAIRWCWAGFRDARQVSLIILGSSAIPSTLNELLTVIIRLLFLIQLKKPYIFKTQKTPDIFTGEFSWLWFWKF